jgi:hypothetical protein
VIHDDVANHLAAAGSYERAAVPLGMYLAWCVNLGLVSDQLTARADSLVLRLRYREITGSELVVAGCDGVLSDEWLNEDGRAFTRDYFPGYYDEFREEFGSDPYGVRDDWVHYDRMARRLTRHLMARRAGGRGGQATGRKRRWWKPW